MELKINKQKYLLEKYDIFYLMFLFYIFGVLLYDKLPILIPLKYEVVQDELLKIIVISFISYFFGKNIFSFRKKLDTRVFIYDNLSIQKIKILFWGFVILSTAFYAFNGLPIAQLGAFAAESKLKITGARSYGITRVLYVMLPFLSLYIYAIFVNKVNMVNKKSFIFYSVITLTILSFGLFKGQLITYFLSMIILHDAFVKSFKINLKSIINLILIIIVTTIPIFLTEINNYSDSLLYMFNRLTIYSWEGLNFIVYRDLPPDIFYQLKSFIGLEYMESPDVILGKEYAGLNNINFAVVPTLFGFCYRNGGYLSIIITFLLLGILVKRIIKNIYSNNDSLVVVTNVMLYIFLFKMFIVGNVFHTVRGPILTLFLIFFSLRFIKRKYKHA